MCFSLWPDRTMSLPMYGRMVPLSPAESLSPHEPLSYHGTGEAERGREEGYDRETSDIYSQKACRYCAV